MWADPPDVMFDDDIDLRKDTLSYKIKYYKLSHSTGTNSTNTTDTNHTQDSMNNTDLRQEGPYV